MAAQRKKRVLILTADAGFGHRSAANAIAAALRETHGGECVIRIVNALNDRRAPRGLRASQADYDRVARDLPELYKLGFRATDAAAAKAMMEAGMQAALYRVMRGLVAEQRPDLIVSTYPLYQAPLGAVFSLTKRFIPLVTVVTDLVTVHHMWFNEYSDLTVVPTKAALRLALAARLPAQRVAVIGIPVHPAIAKERRAKPAIRAALGWEPKLTTVLIVGSRRSRLYVEAAHVLNHSGLPIQLVLATGGDSERYAELRKTRWHRPARVYGFVENLQALMPAADFVVTKAGGLTVAEALACGLPLMLTDVIPGQETGNAAYVVDGGAGEIVAEPLQVLEKTCHWLLDKGALLRKRAANARKLGRPRAVFDIVDRMWELARRGPVTKEASQILALPRLIEFFKRLKVKTDW
jgi:1,2-diacylglycerol 3-beta-galactosyltransferase